MTPGPGLRVLVLAVYLGLAVAVIATVGKRSGVSGYSMARLELAGTAARASGIRAGVVDELTRSAILWDFWFIVGYVILIVAGALYFPARAYRVRKFRRFALSACVLAIFAGVLDALENLAMLRGLSSGSDRPWQIAATVSWAKWLILVVVVGYVLLAAFTFLITPAWVQELLLNPPPPNVTLTPTQAQQPEDHVRTGTPDHDTVHDLERARFGIAASGGGIRSASLVLGSLQALDDAYPKAGQSGTELGDGRQDRLRLGGLLHRRRHQYRPERAPAAALAGRTGGRASPDGGGCLAAGQSRGDPSVEPVGLPARAESLRAVGEDRGRAGTRRQ